jgi:hypothetical protein
MKNKNPLQKFLELFESSSTIAQSELPFQEKSNLAEWLESRVHISL